MKTRQISRSLVATAALGVLLVLTLGFAVAAGSAQSTLPESVYAEHTFSSDLLHQEEAALGLLTIHNQSEQPVALDGLSIELAEGLAYVGPAVGSDVAGPAKIDGSTLHWTGPFDVAAGKSLAMRYWVVAADAAPGQHLAQASISLAGKTLALDGTPLAVLPARDASAVEAAPDLDLPAAPEAISNISATKTAQPGSIRPGNAVIFDVEFYNSGNSAQALDTITDLLPVPFEYIGLAFGSQVDVEPVDPQAPEIVWQGSFSVPGKGTLTLRYWVWVPSDTVVREAPYVNTVTAALGSSSTDPATGTVFVIGPNIEVVKSVSPQEVLSAEYVTYTVTLENTGNDAAVVDLISDTLPVGFEFKGMLSGGTITDPPAGTIGTIAWEGPISILVGGQETLIYQAKTSMASGLESPVNEIVAVYDGKHSAPAAAAVTVKPRLVYVPLIYKNYTAPYFVASKSVTPTQVDVADAEQDVIYTVEFTNPGDDPALLDAIYDMLPSEFMFVGMESGSDVGEPDNPSANPLVWSGPFPQTGPGETLTLKYRVTVAKGTFPGTHDNQVTATTLVGRAPEGPVLATVRVKEPILLWEDFESGTEDWEPFLNYWRLEPEQWYLESNGGFDGSKGIRHTYWLGKPDPDRGAHDAIYMYQGAGSDDWTDYRLETMIRADGAGIQGLWFRGKYIPSEISGRHVEGYYVTWQSYRSRVILWSLSDSGEWAYHFADPHDIATGNYTEDLARHQWYRLAVEVRGSNIKVFVSEAPYTSEYKVIDANDSTFGTGTVGFVGYKMEDTGFDDVLVTPLD